MRDIDELRQLTAGRLLAIWRENSQAEDMERALVCNAQVLSESCFFQGEPVFDGGAAVLETLTAREMEGLLRQLAAGSAPAAAQENPAFDQARFDQLREG
jgi:hypothetical protein